MPEPTGTVTVIPVGIANYERYSRRDDEVASKGQFTALPRVTADIEMLRALFAEPQFRDAGFVFTDSISGSTGEITDRLKDRVSELRNSDGRGAVLVWSGHAEYVPGAGLRLACEGDTKPMNPGDGFSPSELAKKLVGADRPQFYLIIDVCHAAEAAADIASAALKGFNAQPPISGNRGMAVLFATRAADQAEDGGLVPVLEEVLRRGPSPGAREIISKRGLGHWSNQDRWLSPFHLRTALEAETEFLRESEQASVPEPTGFESGTVSLFPNPLHIPDALPENVEVARRRVLHQADADTHFLPKAQGIEPGEDGWFFAGRVVVTRDIIHWLEGKSDTSRDPMLVLTGDGGTGKSAIVTRLVVLSDADYRERVRREGWDEQADQDAGTNPPLGAIDAALHLRGRDETQTASELGDLLGLDLKKKPTSTDLVTTWRKQRVGSPVIVFDALDEASEPEAIARVCRHLADVGWLMLVVTRRASLTQPETDLLDVLGSAYTIRLRDDKQTFEDIASYVKARLVHTPGSPYEHRLLDDPDLVRVAEAIAVRADGKFLYARLVTTTFVHRSEPITLNRGWEKRHLAASVDMEFRRDLEQYDAAFRVRFERADAGATSLLGALAWGYGSGLPLWDGIWTAVANAVSQPAEAYTVEHATWVLVEAGRYILESGENDQAVYRLFHQSLDDLFLTTVDDPTATQGRIYTELQELLPTNKFDEPNPYLDSHLVDHAIEGDQFERYLDDLPVPVKPPPAWMRPFVISGATVTATGRAIYVDPSWLDSDPKRLAPLLVHQMVHVRQWRRYGWIGFLAKYLGDYLRGRNAGLPHESAYRSISLEREAAARTPGRRPR